VPRTVNSPGTAAPPALEAAGPGTDEAPPERALPRSGMARACSLQMCLLRTTRVWRNEWGWCVRSTYFYLYVPGLCMMGAWGMRGVQSVRYCTSSSRRVASPCAGERFCRSAWGAEDRSRIGVVVGGSFGVRHPSLCNLGTVSRKRSVQREAPVVLYSYVNPKSVCVYRCAGFIYTRCFIYLNCKSFVACDPDVSFAEGIRLALKLLAPPRLPLPTNVQRKYKIPPRELPGSRCAEARRRDETRRSSQSPPAPA
jgi:hypothetical protein